MYLGVVSGRGGGQNKVLMAGFFLLFYFFFFFFFFVWYEGFFFFFFLAPDFPKKYIFSTLILRRITFPETTVPQFRDFPSCLTPHRKKHPPPKKPLLGLSNHLPSPHRTRLPKQVHEEVLVFEILRRFFLEAIAPPPSTPFLGTPKKRDRNERHPFRQEDFPHHSQKKPFSHDTPFFPGRIVLTPPLSDPPVLRPSDKEK